MIATKAPAVMSNLTLRHQSPPTTVSVSALIEFCEPEGAPHCFMTREVCGGYRDTYNVNLWKFADGSYEVEVIDMHTYDTEAAYRGNDLYKALRVFAFVGEG